MSKLEKAKILLDSGALTPEEFEQEKARILQGFPTNDGRVTANDTGHNQRKTAAIVLGSAALLFAAHWVWNLSATNPPTEDSGFAVAALATIPDEMEEVQATV